MGNKVESAVGVSFTEQDVRQFSTRINQQLQQLKNLIETPSFGQGPQMFGAELEVYLVDQNFDAVNCNEAILKALNDPAFQVEINQYNLELNLPPLLFEDKPFSAMAASLRSYLDKLLAVAQQQNVSVVPIGILPTLNYDDLDKRNMTQRPRYLLLGRRLQELRGEPFKIEIGGKEPIDFECDDVTAEGANTSFQVHIMVPQKDFVKLYNAFQLSQSLVTAISANSPILLGHCCWHETRIALFKQSLDCQIKQGKGWQEPPRVTFGSGWLRQSEWELYADAVSVYSPLLPLIEDEEKSSSGLPKFKELSLHMGTIWPWNRPVYCADGNGHVRIELRALPAGPTVPDMVANAAFAIGLAFGLRDDIDALLPQIPFQVAESNFYRAAEWGLDAKIMWPLIKGDCQTPVSISSVLKKMLPVAESGLQQLGVDNQEIRTQFDIIQQRLANKMTGAIWQMRTIKALRKTMSREEASRQLVNIYLEQAKLGVPIAEWPKPWE